MQHVLQSGSIRPFGLTADVNTLGEVNAANVVEAIRLLAPISRAELARKTRLKPPALSGIVRYLLDERLVIEGEEIRSSTKGGRPSRLLRLNAGARSILAVDFEPDHLRIAITDLNGSILNYRGLVVDRRKPANETLDLLWKTIRDMGGRRDGFAGIGVSCGGLLDERNGVMLSSTNLPGWKNVPLRSLFAQRFDALFTMGRSVHQAAWAEHWFRDQIHPRKMIVVTLRTGIGFALVDDGMVYRGKNHFDGELGHTVVDIDGLPCECGRRGCLETFISPAAITRRALAIVKAGRGQPLKPWLRNGAEIDPELIYRLARDGDADCQEIVKDLTRYLGIGIGNLVNLFNPDIVVLCGAIDVVNEIVLGELRKEVRQNTLPQSWDGLEIRLSKHAERSALLGAAVYAAQEYLTAVISQPVSAKTA